ncbi:DMP19 family protein [Bradyrhizobium guangdongense]
MIVDGRLRTVIVRHDDFEAAKDPKKAGSLTAAVANCVVELQYFGSYTRNELPEAAIQAYHADLYLGQVLNGGHSQFIHNVGIEMLATTAGDALAGLKAMGASAQHQILQEMIDWVQAHPGEAVVQSGFDNRAPALDALDDRFYEAEEEESMIPLAARWIAGWPELRVVPQEEYASEIKRLAQLHPQQSRRVWRSVEDIRFQMTDDLQITIAAACGAVLPEAECKLEVRAGGKMVVEGQQCMAFGVGTDKGSRLCVFEEAGGRLYEFVARSPTSPVEPAKSETSTNLRRLSVVGADAIRNFSTIAEQNLAAEAIDLLLRKSDLDPVAMITALRVSDEGAVWYAVSGETCITVATLRDRADLVGSDGKAILSVTRAEIERHAAEAAAGGASMRAQA